MDLSYCKSAAYSPKASTERGLIVITWIYHHWEDVNMLTKILGYQSGIISNILGSCERCGISP